MPIDMFTFRCTQASRHVFTDVSMDVYRCRYRYRYASPLPQPLQARLAHCSRKHSLPHPTDPPLLASEIARIRCTRHVRPYTRQTTTCKAPALAPCRTTPPPTFPLPPHRRPANHTASYSVQFGPGLAAHTRSKQVDADLSRPGLPQRSLGVRSPGHCDS